MADFETMPVGTTSALEGAADMFRAYEAIDRGETSDFLKNGMITHPRVRVLVERADFARDVAARLDELAAKPGVERTRVAA